MPAVAMFIDACVGILPLLLPDYFLARRHLSCDAVLVWNRLTELAEVLAHIANQEIGYLHRGEVAAALEL